MCTPRLLRISRPSAYPTSLRHRLLAGTVCLTFLVVAACGDDDGGSPVPTRTYTVAIQQGDGQSALDLTPVAIQPTILVSDDQGAPATGIDVTFSIQSGGGSVTAPPQTLAGGLASADWTLGPLTGNDTVAMNLLRATVTGRHIVGDTVTFLARAWGNRWDSVGPFSGVSRMGSGVVNGRLYLFNGAMGRDAWYGATTWYEPATGRSGMGALEPNTSRDQASAVLGGRIYLAGGGQWDMSTPGFVHRNVDVYDPATNQWTATAHMLSTREQARAAAIDTLIYVVGGRDSLGVTLGSMEAYNPATNTWTARAPMPTPRRMMGAAVLDGKLWVVGGLNAAGTALATVEVYDPVTNSWTTGTPLIAPRQGPAMAVLNGLLYVISGDNVAYPGTPTVEAWNPATGAWARRRDFPWRCWNSGVGVVNGKVYTVGGDNGIYWYGTVARYQP